MSSVQAYEGPVWRFDDGPPGRVFMPATSNGGCPFDCAYCYIPERGQNAIPLSEAQIDEDIARVDEDPRFVRGPRGTRVSLGCDSEPFLDTNLRHTQRVLAYFALRRNPIQIATKCPIPDRIIELAEQWPSTSPPVIVSSSITTVGLASKIERRAPTPIERAQNFDRLRMVAWIGVAIIKPLIAAGIQDIDSFLDLFSRYPPEAILIGSAYRREHAQRVTGAKTHPMAESWIRVPRDEKALQFIDSVREASSCPVFTTSIDLVNWSLEVFHRR